MKSEQIIYENNKTIKLQQIMVKQLKLLLVAALLITGYTEAQTVDEILETLRTPAVRKTGKL